ncbi:uncharacterized protein LOC120664130 isoform X2 [Panicum virgatum]|uniref:uncharacterized protein LOC120664130 isoform X2 n=1 Tax=Panicum virgatum TaxID=38727 RepID=UPI0019D650CC|nr:uncharacterized protein LOC120664130 isoform X2 [Panicum virgatum]
MSRKVSDREDDDDEQEVSRMGEPPQLVRGRPLGVSPRSRQDLIHSQLSVCDEYLVNHIVSYSPLDFPEEWLKLQLLCHFRNQQELAQLLLIQAAHAKVCKAS